MSRAAGSRRGRQQAAWPQPLSRRSRPRAGAEPGHCAKHSRVSRTCALRRSVAQTRGGSGCRAWRPGARAFSVGGTLRCPHDPMMKPARMTEFGPLCTCGNPTYTRESRQKGKGGLWRSELKVGSGTRGFAGRGGGHSGREDEQVVSNQQFALPCR